MGTRIGLCVGLVVLVLAAFSPAFGAGFVDWDDDKNFLANVHYRGLGGEHLSWMFTTLHMGPYQPLAWVTLGLDHTLHGMDPRGYHVTNVLWHALAVVLFFFLARMLFASARPAWSAAKLDLCAALAAVLFGVHPLRVESVAWITERRDVVSGAFFVATALAWIAYARAERGRRRKYALALGLFVLALLSKASVVTLPLALLVADVWPLRRLEKERWRLVVEKLPFLALSGLCTWIAIAGQRATGTAMRALEDHGIARRIAQSAYAAWFHTSRTIWPADLSPIYDMPSPFVASEPRFVLAIAFALAASALLWCLRRRIPAASAGWFAFLLLLAPVSGLVSIGPQLVADRYSYLACMPYALLGAGLVGEFAPRTRGLVAPAAALCVCAGLTFATHRQTTHWSDSRSLWERAFAVDPRSAVACDHLGNVRVNQSQAAGLDVAARRRLLQEAITLYTQAYETAPHPNQVFNIGGAVMEIATLDPATRAAELDLARQTFEQGLEFAERTSGVRPEWRVMYASALVELGRRDDARKELAIVLRDAPNHVNALRWSARIAFDEQRNDEGIALLVRTTEIDPEDPRSWSILANALQSLGRSQEAKTARERLRELEARFAQ